MMNGYDRERERRSNLHRAILVHLTENGSVGWGAIYSQFYQDGDHKIAETLFELTNKKHIVVESDGTARITALGTEQLKNRQ